MTAANSQNSAQKQSDSKCKTNCENLFDDVDEKGYVKDEVRDAFFKKYRSILGNRSCFECATRNNSWLSTTYSIFLCLNCSSNHRRMGTHLSFVRSCDLDKFTPTQLLRMSIGGNSRATNFFKQHGSLDNKHIDYYGKNALKYRTLLEKEVNDKLTVLRNRVKSPEDTVSSFELLSIVDNDVILSQNSLTTQLVESLNTNTALTDNIIRDTSLNIIHEPESPNRMPDSAASYIAVNDQMSSAGHHQVKSKIGIASTSMTTSQYLLKGRKGDFDFDFDAIDTDDLTLHNQDNKTNQDKMMNTVNSSTSTPRDHKEFPIESSFSNGYRLYRPPTPSDRPLPHSDHLQKFSASKAISSENYFNYSNQSTTSSDDVEIKHRMQHLGNVNCISSDMLFDNPDQSVNRTIKTDSPQNTSDTAVSQFADQARDHLQTISTGAQQAFSNAKDWFMQWNL